MGECCQHLNEKYGCPRCEAEALRTEVSRLTAELDGWRNKAVHLQRLLDGAQARVTDLTAELDGLRAQEPVGYIAPHVWRVHQSEFTAKITRKPAYEHTIAVYLGPVPAAQAVPEAMEQHPLRGDEPVGPQAARMDFVRGWNACRDAMLAAAPQPTIPDGDALLYAAEAKRGGS